jgi:hypothetical protein
MTDDMLDLARRAVACKGWRWMPGMLTTEGMRVVVRCFNDDNEPDDDIPDLTDPATLGCLLALVREATTAYASLTFEPGYLHTEVENLVAALEAAP